MPRIANGIIQLDPNYKYIYVSLRDTDNRQSLTITLKITVFFSFFWYHVYFIFRNYIVTFDVDYYPFSTMYYYAIE